MAAPSPSPAPSPTGDDVASVQEASRLLEVSELELFRIAWAKWHGGGIGEAQLERRYRPYARERQVPVWVRELVRKVLRESRAGELNPANYRVMPEPISPPPGRGRRRLLWLALFLGVVLVAAAALAGDATPTAMTR